MAEVIFENTIYSEKLCFANKYITIDQPDKNDLFLPGSSFLYFITLLFGVFPAIPQSNLEVGNQIPDILRWMDG